MVREKSGLAESRPAQASTVGYGRYQLIKKLAAGGMAEVYLARQSGMEGFEKLVVVKRILPHLASDQEFVQMFLNEARIAARFNHANIVQIYDLGKIEDTYFIAMEYIHGEDLGRIMRKAWNAGSWLPPELALRALAGACEGLHYAHVKTDDSGRPLNVIHRDISPQNILVSFDGGVKIVDFGIAKAADSSNATRAGTIKGKYAYMSPEQAQGKDVDARTDVFALGLVLYELLTGVRPLKRETDIQTLQAALACEIEVPSKVASISDAMDALVMKALTRDVNARYQSAQEFQLAIEDFLVTNQMAASSVHLAEFMKGLFAERLSEEARSGRPAPSVSDPSFPSVPVQEVGTGPQVPDVPSWEAPSGEVPSPGENTQSRRTRATLGDIAPPAPAEDDPDDGATVEERAAPRRTKSGQMKRPTGEVRRPSRELASPRRTSTGSRAVGRSRSGSGVAAESGMPAAPPRQNTKSRSRDDSWKDSNRPRSDDRGERRRGALGPVLAMLLVLGGGAAYVMRGQIAAFAGARGGGSDSKPAASATVSLATNVAVQVEVNGEVVGQTPIRNYPVKPGKVTARYFSPAQGIDKSFVYEVKQGEAFVKHEEFAFGHVQFTSNRSVTADVYLNGKRIGQTGTRMEMAAGEYDFVAKADNGTLEDRTRATIKPNIINFVKFDLRRH